MKFDTKQLKLISGEEIITEIVDSVANDDSLPYDALVIKNPYLVDGDRSNIYLRPYIMMSKFDQFHLVNIDHCTLITDVNAVLLSMYKKTMKLYHMNHPETIADDKDPNIYREVDWSDDSSPCNIIKFDPNKMH